MAWEGGTSEMTPGHPIGFMSALTFTSSVTSAESLTWALGLRFLKWKAGLPIACETIST